MDKKIYEIYSEKYGVNGQLLDYGVVIKLQFTYNDRDHSIGLSRPFQEELADMGLRVMEGTIESILGKEASETACKPMLHRWYLDRQGEYIIGHGVVTGHKKLPDTMRIHTSPVSGIEIDSEHGDALVITKNTTYRCPLDSLRFSKQDAFPELIPDYDTIKENYSKPIEKPEIEQGKVLLVLSDYDEYYFHSLCVKGEDNEPLPYSGWPHVGMFQDSYLIGTEDGKIDLRYFPHFKNIEFYSSETDGMPLYVENIGSSVLYIQYGGHDFRFDPGERKELTEENASKDTPDLPDGDLYPAGIIE